MAHAVLSVPHFFGPLQALWHWATSRTHPSSRATRPAAPRMTARWAVQAAPQRARPMPPLRVVRVVDPSQTRGGAGRMVISGRMAEVCAELERLAEREAQQG